MGTRARIRSHGSILPLAFFFALTSTPLHPQAKTAVISGTVTDSTGALIPGASVTLHAADGAQKTAVSDALGGYRVRTAWGNFDTAPVAGQTVIPRNLGTSPGMIGFNMRISRAFGFGSRTGQVGEAARSEQHGSGGPGGGGPMGHYQGAEAVAQDRSYSLTLTVAAHNVLNTVNLDTPVGNLSSPNFGMSTSTHGFGSGSASANRTIEIQAKFAF